MGLVDLLVERRSALSAALDEFLTASGAELDAAGAALAQALAAGGTVFLCGNGGSAAHALHVEAELVGRYRDDRRPLPALHLGLGASSLTAIGNDFGEAEVFARPLAALASAGDALLAISTSGASPNVLRALESARERGLLTILVTGPGASAEAADWVLPFPGASADAIQDGHQLILHTLMDAIEASLAGR